MGLQCSSITLEEAQGLALVNSISALASFFGSVATILCHLFRSSTTTDEELENQEEIQSFKKSLILKLKDTSFQALIFWLAIANALACVSIWIMNATPLWDDDFEMSTRVCITFGAVGQYFMFSPIVWTCCMAIELRYQVKTLFPMSRTRMFLIYHAASWGIPLIIVVAYVNSGGVSYEEGESVCTVSIPLQWGCWVIPLTLCMIWITYFYFSVSRNAKLFEGLYSHSMSTNPRGVQHMKEKKLGDYLLVFIFCWSWDLIYHMVYTAINKPECTLYWFYVIVKFVSPLQGFLNFVVYAFANGIIGSRKPTARIMTSNKKLSIPQDFIRYGSL